MPGRILVTFAVKEETQFFPCPAQAAALITGMGRINASRTLRSYLAHTRPEVVLTSGFAGGLNPVLKIGDVLVEDPDRCLGSLPNVQFGRFHCSDRIAITAREKSTLHAQSGCDAVEMESAELHRICQESRIPCATVRVISDASDEDLPLDFNRLMTPELRINYPGLIWTILKRPSAIPALIAFQKKVKIAARNLAAALTLTIESYHTKRDGGA